MAISFVGVLSLDPRQMSLVITSALKSSIYLVTGSPLFLYMCIALGYGMVKVDVACVVCQTGLDSPPLCLFPVSLPCVSSRCLFPVSLPCVSSLCLFPVSLPCVSSLCLFPVSLPCVSSLCLFPVSLPCVSSLCLFPVSLPCVSSLCLFSVSLPCVSSLCLFSVSLPCVSSLCLFPVMSITRHRRQSSRISRGFAVLRTVAILSAGGVQRFYKLVIFLHFTVFLQTRHFPPFYSVSTNSPFSPFLAFLHTRRFLEAGLRHPLVITDMNI